MTREEYGLFRTSAFRLPHGELLHVTLRSTVRVGASPWTPYREVQMRVTLEEHILLRASGCELPNRDSPTLMGICSTIVGFLKAVLIPQW